MLLDLVKFICPVHVFHIRGIIDFGRCAMKLFRGRIVLIWFDCLVVLLHHDDIHDGPIIIYVTFHGIQVPREYFIINIRPVPLGHNGM